MCKEVVACNYFVPWIAQWMTIIVLAWMVCLGCMMSSESSIYVYISLRGYPAKPLNAHACRLKYVGEGTHSLCVMKTVTMLEKQCASSYGVGVWLG